jgi:hypothetical protein
MGETFGARGYFVSAAGPDETTVRAWIVIRKKKTSGTSR